MTSIHLVGYASGEAAAKNGCKDAPYVLQHSSHFSALINEAIHLYWEEVFEPRAILSSKTEKIINLCTAVAECVHRLAIKKKFFIVLGGDHSSAIGTWSGAYHTIQDKGDLGLIWIDAHMDSHTFKTTTTGNIHGMPVACLLGYGESQLINLLTANPKIKPENLCLIGTRSFEPGEEALLKGLNVRIFMMEEIRQRGLSEIMREAIQIVSSKTVAFGVSLDIDSIDPNDAPGTGVREKGGIAAGDLCQALHLITHHPKLIGLEISEFDPSRDIDQITEKLIPQLILSVVQGQMTRGVPV